MTLPTDPSFYAVAVPAVLLMGISKSGFGSGFGALAVPLMALAMPVPQAAAIMLPLRLAPLTFTATMAVFFAAINASKGLPYARLGLLDGSKLLTSLVLMPLAPVGVWLGVRVVRRVPPRLFYALFEIGMVITGAKLLWDAWRTGSG